MSEEEKKAIEHIKNYPKNWLFEEVNEMAIKVVLNLIENQQKEIEYWKEQAEGYSGLAQQMKEDFENRDRWE